MSLPLDEQLCDDCRFFISDGTTFAGECHRKPPKIMRRPTRDEQHNRGVWPGVTTSDWCGEFEQRPGDGGE
ncbi:hypothetical protein [Tardiphaga sp. 803_E3_N1_3]|uniref:hypothetical protein n=1 Tax=Tardiphaga sp. 803_E3_N1_3 TaxID=3240785 RepID=UPI003F27CF70